jgi:hypothetical protein
MRCGEWMEIKRKKFGMEENQERSKLDEVYERKGREKYLR